MIINQRVLLDPGAKVPSGGSDVFSGTPPPETVVPQTPDPVTPVAPVESATPPPADQAVSVPPSTPPPAITAESLAKAMADAGIGKQAPPVAASPARQYTQDEFDKAFHVVRPTQEQIAKLLAGGADALTTLTEILHATARQGVVMSAYQMAELKKELLDQVNPLQSYVAQQNEEKLRQEFYKKNEGFKGFETVIDFVVESVRATNPKFKNKEEAFAAVIAGATKIIQSIPGQEKWVPGKAAAAATPAASHMPTLAKGGGSGGASASAGLPASAKKSPGMAVFS